MHSLDSYSVFKYAFTAKSRTKAKFSFPWFDKWNHADIELTEREG